MKKHENLLQAMNKGKAGYLFILPYVLIFFTFTVLPVLISIVFSFTSFNVLEWPEFVGFENYSRLFFSDSVFVTGVKNTIVFAVILGPGGFLISLI